MKLKNKLTVLAISLLLLFTTSCDIVDALSTYPVNIPLSQTFSTSGTNTTIAEEESFCVSNDDTYQEYKDKIKKVTFVKVAFRTISYSPSNLQGDITLYLKDASGVTLFTESITGAKPGDYVNTPYEISLEDSEIQAIDSYLETALAANSELCFTSGINIQITSGGTTNSIEGAIDIVFEAETEL
ncbi:MAG: hypothetical protein V3V16_12475 [Melioribacteraceae bacterium]